MRYKKIEKTYEVGFHIIPTLSTKDAESLVEEMKKEIQNHAEVLSTEEAELIDLAYEIRHNVRKSDGSHNRYDKAYFSSIKFNAAQENVSKVDSYIKSLESIFRFIVLETVSENTRVDKELLEEKKDKAEKVEKVDKR